MSSIQFQISYEGDLLVKKEDTVSFQTPLYNQNKRETVSVVLAKVLGTDPSKIFQSLKKFVGDSVNKGDIIAESSAFLSTKRYVSEYNGVLKEINHQEGSIMFEVKSDSQDEVNAFFVGEVQDIEEKSADDSGMKTAMIKLKTKSAKEFDIKEASMDFGGEVVYCKDPIKAGLTADDVNYHIVVDERIPSYEQVKYEALGAIGFISLHSLPEDSTAGFAKLSSNSDYEKVEDTKLPYCLVSKSDKKIFFYE